LSFFLNFTPLFVRRGVFPFYSRRDLMPTSWRSSWTAVLCSSTE